MTRDDNPSSSQAETNWPDVVRFVRQLSHDLRNHLNAIELQSAFLAEIAADDEMKEEVKRLRQMVGGMGSTLQQLSQKMAVPSPTLMPYPTNEFLEDIAKKVG